MNIVFINASGDTFTPTRSGAIGTWIWEVCRAARRAGAEPLVISKNQAAAPYDWAQRILVDYPCIPKGRVATFVMRAHRKLSGWDTFRQGNFAARVARAVKAAGVVDQPLFLQNDPELAVYLRERFPKAYIIHHFQNQKECRPRFRGRFARSADVVTAVSDFTARWLESYFGMGAGVVKTLYSGVDVERFRPASPPPSTPPVINFIGRTGIEKAPDLILKAALKLATKTRDFAVQILGSNHMARVEMDEYQLQLQELSERLEQMGIVVRRPGHVLRADLPSELQKAHIHVTPSRWDEPFGLVTLEGMACGLATLASHTGGSPEVIGDGGLLFNRDDDADLADKLEPWIRDDILRLKYAAKARAWAEQRTWDRTWSEVCRVVREGR